MLEGSNKFWSKNLFGGKGSKLFASCPPPPYNAEWNKVILRFCLHQLTSKRHYIDILCVDPTFVTSITLVYQIQASRRLMNIQHFLKSLFLKSLRQICICLRFFVLLYSSLANRCIRVLSFNDLIVDRDHSLSAGWVAEGPMILDRASCFWQLTKGGDRRDGSSVSYYIFPRA